MRDADEFFRVGVYCVMLIECGLIVAYEGGLTINILQVGVVQRVIIVFGSHDVGLSRIEVFDSFQDSIKTET